MKYMIALMFLLAGCASVGGECPDSDRSELCQCYRREVPRDVCFDRTNRFDRR